MNPLDIIQIVNSLRIQKEVINMASIMTVRAPDDLQEILKEQAKKLGYPRNALILQILQAWVKGNPPPDKSA